MKRIELTNTSKITRITYTYNFKIINGKDRIPPYIPASCRITMCDNHLVSHDIAVDGSDPENVLIAQAFVLKQINKLRKGLK